MKKHRGVMGKVVGVRRHVAVLLGMTSLTIVSLAGQWVQFGGPERNFVSESDSLATDWPESGPGRLWERELGDGFSSILVKDGRLYTMYRRGEEDVVVAMEASTGKTVWETSYASPTVEGMLLDFGAGPISTPAIAGDRIFTVSSTVKLHCLDIRDGSIVWKHDLAAEMGARHMGRGYGPSPTVYEDLVILNVGGKGQGMVAFRQSDGTIAWQSMDARASYSSPFVARVLGVDQLLVAAGNQRAGLDPRTGSVRWKLELPGGASSIMATQHWNPEDQTLFSSSAYADGSRAVRLSRQGEAFQAEELWYSRRMRVMFSSFVRIGDHVYGSSGDFGPIFLMCLDIKNGRVVWRKRGWSRTHFVRAGKNVVLLDEEGDLAIATASPEGLQVHSRSKVLERTCWTPPTIVESTAYIRNRKRIKALDLSQTSARPGDEG